MKSVSREMTISLLVCLLIFGAGNPCRAQTRTGKGTKVGHENVVTLKGIAKAVPDQAGVATRHLEMTVAGVTYRLKSDMLTQADVRRCDGDNFTVTGTIRSSSDKVKTLDVLSYEYVSITSPSSAAPGKANEFSSAAGKQSPMLGNWNVYFHGALCDESLRIFHPDGRFEVPGRSEWNGSYQFTNPDKTQLKMTCNNGQTRTLDYKKDSDTMVENTGAIFRRAKKQDSAVPQLPTASNKPVTATAPTAAKTTWYNLKKNEKYVTEFLLNPGMSKNVTILAKQTLMVWFESNATYEQTQKYGMTPTHPLTGIQMEQTGTHDRIESVGGGGTTFTPKNGKIDLKITNRTKEALKVVVYYKDE
jgi:hypothetical protein